VDKNKAAPDYGAAFRLSSIGTFNFGRLGQHRIPAAHRAWKKSAGQTGR